MVTIGEAARRRLVELAKEEGVNPYELVINCGDVCLLHEIGEICGRRGSDHPLKFRRRVMDGIRKSGLFELRGYLSLPERGRGRIACYGLKRGVLVGGSE
jgi:hypothetical protein